MKAKIFNTGLATLVLTLGLYSLCFAKVTNGTLAVLDPLNDINAKIIKSPCGNFMQIDAKTKHLHLKGKDIELLMGPGIPDNSNITVTTTPNCNTSEQGNKDQDNQPNDGDDADQKVKNYSKSYSADAYTRLDIDNRNGNVSVKTWTKNEFKVDVQIKAYANDDAETQKLLDQTSVTDSKENDLVSFKTVINSGNHSNTLWESWSSNGKTSVHKMVVNYTVYMPAKSAVSITNRYGLIDLPILSGKVTIDNAYGGLTAKSLTNADNVINVKYGNANIGNLEGSDLNVSYGNLNLDVADRVAARLQFTQAKIGKISNSGNITVHYGDGVQIKDLDKNLKTLTVKSTFAPIKLGSLNDVNADFDVTVRMAPFIYTNDVNVITKSPADEKGSNTTKNYKGHIGKGNADKVITINASYGNGVKFEQ